MQIFSCCFIALKKQPLDSFDTTIYANVESLVINLLVVSSFYRFCSICGFPPPITSFLVVLGFLSFDSDQSKVRAPTPLRAADAPPKLTRWHRLIDFCCSFATAFGIFGSGCIIIWKNAIICKASKQSLPAHSIHYRNCALKTGLVRVSALSPCCIQHP